MICNEVKATGGTKIGYYILLRKYKSEVDIKEAFLELRRSWLKKFLTENLLSRPFLSVVSSDILLRRPLL